MSFLVSSQPMKMQATLAYMEVYLLSPRLVILQGPAGMQGKVSFLVNAYSCSVFLVC